MMDYKKFKVGELFDIHPTKSYKMTNRKLMDNDGKVAVLTNTSINNGVGGWSNLEPTETDSLPMITFSDTTTGPDTLFVQTKPYIGYSHVQGMYSKIDHHWTDLELLYVVVAIKAGAGTGWSYATKFNRKRVSNLDILLPVTSSGQPDFEYMTQYIKDVEWQCVDDLEVKQKEELQAYLQVTELDDTTLSGSEAAALTQKVVWKKFRIGGVFDKPGKGDVDLQNSDVDGTGEFFINSGSTNSGIKGRTSRPARIFPANTITIDFFGNAYYRDFSYKLATHNHVFSFESDLIKSREVGLFIVSSLSYLKHAFSYNNMLTWNKLKNMSIMLPIKTDGSIDFIYMQNYIRAIEKLTIKNVVKHRNNVINTTQSIIN